MKTEKELKNIYQRILERFPIGREAAYLLNNKSIDIDIIRQNLKYISEGKDSDRRYTDEQSRKDALEFLIELDS